MQNFVYFNPTKLLFGKGQIGALGNEVPEDAKVMIVYGGGSVLKNGVMSQVKQALGGRFVREFGGIEPNPDYDTCLKAVEAIRREGCNFVLAVGGGSVVDAVKFIVAACELPSGTDPFQIIETGGEIIRAALPFGVVLTLPATGSEANSGSVISRRSMEDKRSFGSGLVFPKFSVLDPETTYSLPYEQVANGIVDAWVHVLEQYATFPQEAAVQDQIAEGLLRILHKEGLRVKTHLNDYACRANIMYAATMALNGLIGAGVKHDWMAHNLGHYLTAHYGLAHGRTLALTSLGVLREMLPEKEAKIAQLGRRVFDIVEPNDRKAAEWAIAKMEGFYRQLGMPTRLVEAGIGLEVTQNAEKWHKERGQLTFGEHAIPLERALKVYNHL